MWIGRFEPILKICVKHGNYYTQLENQECPVCSTTQIYLKQILKAHKNAATSKLKF